MKPRYQISVEGLKNTEASTLTEVFVADTLWLQMRGLLFRPKLKPSQALLIPRCKMVHMFGMHYAIDVVFCDRDDRILHISKNLKPFCLSRYVFKASYAVEIVAGGAEELGLRIGGRMLFNP